MPLDPNFVFTNIELTPSEDVYVANLVIKDTNERRTIFSSLDGNSGVASLSDSLLINSIAETPTFKIKGDDATYIEWAPAIGAGSLGLVGTGNLPIVQANAFGNGDDDKMVLFEKGQSFESSDATVGNMGPGDIVIELIFFYRADSDPEIFIHKRASLNRGYSLNLNNTGQLELTLYASLGSDIVVSPLPVNAMRNNNYNHAIWFLDRDGEGICYVNGLPGTSTTLNSTDGVSLSNNIPLRIGSEDDVGTSRAGLVQFSVWEHPGTWLDTHLKPDIANERYQTWCNIWPQRADGTEEPSWLPPRSTADIAYDYDVATGQTTIQGIGARVAAVGIVEDGAEAPTPTQPEPLLDRIPDVPVSETWAWLTNVITAWDGTEQRIALRDVPRRTLSYSYIIPDEDARRVHYDDLWDYAGNPVPVPYLQYSTDVTSYHPVGEVFLALDTSKTDLQTLDYISIIDTKTGLTQTNRVALILDDSVLLTTPLQQVVEQGYIAAPALMSLYQDGSGLTMTSVAGTFNISTRSIQVRGFVRERENPVTHYPIHDDMPVLDKIPRADGGADESFVSEYIIRDGLTGIVEAKTKWLHAKIDGARSYYVPRGTNPAEMDYWRDITNEMHGQRDPFLLPTFREDLTLYNPVIQGSDQIIINQTDYVTRYFPYETYKRIQVTSTDGTEYVYRTIDSAVVDVNGQVTLTLEEALPNDSNFAGGALKISYLNKVRLGSDTIRLDHYQIYSILTLDIRTIDE